MIFMSRTQAFEPQPSCRAMQSLSNAIQPAAVARFN
jgi:hypothetical protein